MGLGFRGLGLGFRAVGFKASWGLGQVCVAILVFRSRGWEFSPPGWVANKPSAISILIGRTLFATSQCPHWALNPKKAPNPAVVVVVVVVGVVVVEEAAATTAAVVSSSSRRRAV